MNNEKQQLPIQWREDIRFENVRIRSLAVKKRATYLRQILGTGFHRPQHTTLSLPDNTAKLNFPR
jgi:hypothetical protein